MPAFAPKYFHNGTPSKGGKLFSVVFMEKVNLVVFEENNFEYREKGIPFVIQAWSGSKDYTMYTTCSRKIVLELKFWCLMPR